MILGVVIKMLMIARVRLNYIINKMLKNLTLHKNLSPDGKIKVMIKPVNKQLSITDIEEEREKNKREKYKIL